MRSLLAFLSLGLAACPFPVGAAGDHADLARLANDWRHFEQPTMNHCVPEYGAQAMAAKSAGLPAYRARLAAIDGQGWSAAQKVDQRLIEAEMNGLDFDLRVRRPWARDPSFYATVFGERSDVPQHEGVTAAPSIDLFAYDFPLSRADQRSLTCLLDAIPALLEQAKINLHDSNARDLWVYSVRTLRSQSEVLANLQAGTLDMRTLEGSKHASLAGAGKVLPAAVQRARAATDAFALWLAAEAPTKTGPSGVGKENYNWYLQKVHLVPYDWEQQVTLLRRELERARTGLSLEEFHNRALPPIDPANTPQAFRALVEARMQRLTDFLIDSGIVPDKKYYRDALAHQVLDFVPPEKRNFFLQASAREPLGLFSHDYHWIELARMKEEPNGSSIRRLPALSNMFDSRSEGLATAMEETLMQAGLYDDNPRGREIVWIMLANRAARGLASLYVQANEMTLQQAGSFHAQWTPRGWSDPSSDLVAFEQLLYLRQPGYGTSYITGKLQFERLISDYARQQEAAGKPFDLAEFFTRMNQSGTIPFSLIETELVASPLRIDSVERK
ncbi:MAG: hypothetical protein QOI88_786 [Gammaproteobacteria bacterium]|jgi:hypothetical protein|nr:hypothetical protein [Gammaproteobacteria bacterium]